MSLESDADLDAYFDVDDMGTQARWSFTGGYVVGIFDAAYVDPLGLFESVAPVFVVRSDDDYAQAQTLKIGDTTYTIVEVRPDGTGVTTLRLRT